MAQHVDDRDGEVDLKYLGFLRVATHKAVSAMWSVYSLGKQNSGSLKSRLDAVERSVQNIVTPIYGKIHDKPLQILAFADRKLEEAIHTIERHASSTTKKCTLQILDSGKAFIADVKEKGVVVTTKDVAEDVYKKTEPLVNALYSRAEPIAKGLYLKAQPIAKGLYLKAQPIAKGLYIKYEPVAKHWTLVAWYRLLDLKAQPIAKGLYLKAQPIAKGLYIKYEPVAKHWTLVAWYRLLDFSVAQHAVEMLLPMGVQCLQIYNSGVRYLSDGNFKIASILPEVPVEKVKNSIKQSLDDRKSLRAPKEDKLKSVETHATETSESKAEAETPGTVVP